MQSLGAAPASGIVFTAEVVRVVRPVEVSTVPLAPSRELIMKSGRAERAA